MAQVMKLQSKELASVHQLARALLQFPVKKLWTDYDEEADVLYLSFRRPQKATDSEMRDDGIIVRKRGKEIVGLTILDASTR